MESNADVCEPQNVSSGACLINTCRVCIRKKKYKLQTLFGDCKIVDKIRFCTGILLTENPVLPSLICKECISQLDIACKFKQMCIESGNTYQNLIKEEIKIEKIEPSVKQEVEHEYVDSKNKEEVLIKKITNVKKTQESKVGRSTAIPVNICTLKLRVVHCSAKSFAMICKDKEKNEKEAPKKRTRFTFRKLVCLKCNIRFDTKEESIKHHRLMHNMSKFVCEVCGKEFLYTSARTAHMRIHRGVTHGCAHCSYRTVNKNDLKSHLTIHTGERKYQCHACPQAYRTSSNLHFHIRQKHGGERKYSCQHCGKMFADKGLLVKHAMIHEQNKRFECTVCHSRFSDRNHWKRHLLTLHGISLPRAKPGPRRTDLTEATPSVFNSETDNVNLNVKDKSES